MLPTRIRAVASTAATLRAFVPVHSIVPTAIAACKPAVSAAYIPPAPANVRCIHVTAPTESTMLLVAGVGVGAAALIANYALKAVDSSTTASSEAPATTTANDASTQGTSSSDTASTAENANKASEASAGTKEETAAKQKAASGGMWNSIFGGQAMAKRFYKGGFEDKMTRREAALILGVRESATPERVRDRHRKLLMVNHPDAGGSTFIASKINEAKDVLIKGRPSS